MSPKCHGDGWGARPLQDIPDLISVQFHILWTEYSLDRRGVSTVQTGHVHGMVVLSKGGGVPPNFCTLKTVTSLHEGCEGLIRQRPPGPHPRIHLALPSSRGEFGIEIGSNQEINVKSMPNRPSGSDKKNELKPKLFGPVIFGWGGVFHVKGWGPKSSVCPSKPRETKLIWRDIRRIV